MAKETPSDRHNRHTNAFVQSIVREVIEDGGKDTEVMVVLESLILGVMLVNLKAFRLKPETCVAYVEVAAQQAIERFTAALKGDDNG